MEVRGEFGMSEGGEWAGGCARERVPKRVKECPFPSLRGAHAAACLSVLQPPTMRCELGLVPVCAAVTCV